MVKYPVYVAKVAAVRVAGNAHVNQVTIDKLLQLRAGMTFNTELMKADEQRLRAIGKFEKINASIDANPNKPQDITLVWVIDR